MTTTKKHSNNGTFELGHYRFHRDERQQLVFLPSAPGLEGYLAFDLKENNFVQVRLLKTPDTDTRATFKEVWKSIREKNDCTICPEILALGEEENVPYYVSTLPAGEPVSFFVKRGGPLPPEVAVKLVLRFIRSLKAQNPVSYETFGMSPEAVWITRSSEEPRLILGDFSPVPVNSAEAKNAHLCLDLLKFLSGNPPFNEVFQDLIMSVEKGPQTMGYLLSKLEDYQEANPAATFWTDFNQPNPILHQLVPPEVAIQTAVPSPDSEAIAGTSHERPLWQYIAGIGLAAVAFGLLALAGLVFLTRDEPVPDSVVYNEPVDETPVSPVVEPPKPENEIEQFPVPEVTGLAEKPVEKIQVNQPLPALPPVDIEMPDEGPETPVVAEVKPVVPKVAIPVVETGEEEDKLSQLAEQAAKERSRGQTIKAVEKEIEILKLDSKSIEARIRLNDDLVALRDAPPGDSWTTTDLDIMQRAAVENPKALDLLVSHYRNEGEWGKEIETLVRIGKADRPDKLREAGVRIFQNPAATEVDLKLAREYFIEAAGEGDSEAQFYAGECLVLGRGGSKDPTRGTEYLRKAISQGDARAMDLLGVCYVRAWGVERDDSRAVELFQAAIDGGNIPAYYNLGARYAQGQGVERDPEKAADIFTEGGRKGNAHCMLVLARCFETGYGREQDPDQATLWYSKSAQQGNADAVKWCSENNVDFRKYLADS
ncbi:MAG: hypothetical protein P1V20_29160 [Verrucomicrobiales bacterium]|nr:hypothetical protein [Verrucomicrobiales bacterium]